MSDLVPIRLTRARTASRALEVGASQVAQVMCSDISRSVHGENPAFGAYVTRKNVWVYLNMRWPTGCRNTGTGQSH